MPLMNDKVAHKYINVVPSVDWSTNTEYLHNNYKWIIRPLSATGSFECETYQNKKIVRQNLIINEQVGAAGDHDNAGLNHIYNQTITSIPRCTIVDCDIVYVPVGTTWAQVIVDGHMKAVALSYYNNIVKVTVLCTFYCDLTLPFGLPIFNNGLDRIVAFVGRRLPNGRYVIDAASNQKISRHILSNEKLQINFIDLVNSKDRQIIKSQKRVVLYGNQLFRNGLATHEIRRLETRFNDNEEEKRINVLQDENGVTINITNDENIDAAELESFSFRNTKLVNYFVLPPIQEFVVDEEESAIITGKFKKNKNK